MLALGGDDVLKQIAELDLAEPKESEAQSSVVRRPRTGGFLAGAE